MKTPEQIQFQGSAQSRGFAPVTQASPTRLIEENTDRLLAGQARNFEMEAANLDAVNALQRKFAKQDIDALAAMSGTLADVLTQEAKRQGEADMQEGLMEAYLDGIDPAEAKSVTKLKCLVLHLWEPRRLESLADGKLMVMQWVWLRTLVEPTPLGWIRLCLTCHLA